MGKWGHRSGLYQGTFVLIILVFFVYSLAFSVPTWYGTSDSYTGLWLKCNGSDDDFSDCTTNAFGDDSDWMDAVRGVWVGGAAFFVLAVIYGLAENCCVDERTKDYGITGILTLLAGLCGAAGVIVVAVKTADEDDRDTYYWGFILACASSGLALILAVVLLITKSLVIKEKEPRNNRTADYVFAHKQGSPYSSEYTNQGFTRDDVPLANGVPYHSHQQPVAPYSMYRGGEGLYPTNSLQRNGVGYNNPYDVNRPNQRYSMAESADLSNGYTSELIQAEQTLNRSGRGMEYPPREYGREYPPRAGPEYGRSDYPGRQDYYMNGGRY